MAGSSDRRPLLLGEAEWSHRAGPVALLAKLSRKAQRVPFRHRRQVHFASWLKHGRREGVDLHAGHGDVGAALGGTVTDPEGDRAT